MVIIDGLKIADEILEGLKKKISENKLKLRLAAVLVGNNLEFVKFVQFKGRAAEKMGVEFPIYQFPEEIKTEVLAKRIGEILGITDGMLIEMPLPKQIDSTKVLNEISVKKDVDVLSQKAQDLFYANKSEINPPAVEALKIILEKHGIVIKGKKAAVFGQGVLVGKPISHWLEQQGVEVYRIRSTTEKPEELSRQADIIITGVGKSGLVTGDMVKDGAVVIDFGYGRNAMGKMVGDVDFESVSSRASLITPVPGGMGPILIAAVLKNLILLNS